MIIITIISIIYNVYIYIANSSYVTSIMANLRYPAKINSPIDTKRLKD